MFWQASHARSRIPDMAEIERRMRALENRLERLADTAGHGVSEMVERTSAGMADANDRIGPAVAAALNEITRRVRGSSRAASQATARFGSEAVRYGNEAAKIGNDAVRRLVDEVEHRPLMMLAVAAGVGLLVGLAGRGIDLGEKPPQRRAGKRSH